MKVIFMFFLHIAVLFLCSRHSQSQEIKDEKYRAGTTAYLPEGTRPNDAKILLLITADFSSNNQIEDCKIVTDSDRINDMLKETSSSNVQTVTERQFQELENDCKQFRDSTSKSNPQNGTIQQSDVQHGAENESSSWNIIFPGTKWCGAGDIAKHYDDLGMYSETDRCCRAHDKCDDLIPAGESKYNLTNTSPFTKLSCQCDNDFYDCLDRVDSMISNKIGNLYFNILRRDCYTFDYPFTKKCKTFRTFIKLTCKEYEKNTKGPKAYRWEQPRTYKKLPIPGPIKIEIPF